MAIGVTLPDIPYLPTRETLLKYEDARFASLTSAMPNCYGPLSDSTIWGSFLRAIAQELSRLEYTYTYDLVSLEPQYLTPPDIKRRWADPLFINRSFPNQAQADQDYKAMLVALLAAYRQGTTLEGVIAVIQAYTGQTVVVEELYKEIGNGTVFDYDRNTLRLSVDGTAAGGQDPLSAITAAAWIQTISQDLLTAINLAKPAHVGLDYSVSFGSNENLHSIIAGMTDTLLPVFDGVEAPPLPLIFTQAPFFDSSSPDTRLSAYGKLVSEYFSSPIDTTAFNALSTTFQDEYLPNGDGTYSLNPDSLNDVVLVDSNNNPTGEISKAEGVLAPQLVKSWQIKRDSLTIFELD